MLDYFNVIYVKIKKKKINVMLHATFITNACYMYNIITLSHRLL